ncbi:hypothetical protein [Paenibacillus amylolyticus]
MEKGKPKSIPPFGGTGDVHIREARRCVKGKSVVERQGVSSKDQIAR